MDQIERTFKNDIDTIYFNKRKFTYKIIVEYLYDFDFDLIFYDEPKIFEIVNNLMYNDI